MMDREHTQDAPVMDGATEAAPEEKRDGAQQQRQADVAVSSDEDASADDDLADDLRSIRAYGEDR